MKVSFSVVCFSLLCCLTGCFTGVENTGRISEKDVAKVKADKKTAEELFLDTVHHRVSEDGSRVNYCM